MSAPSAGDNVPAPGRFDAMFGPTELPDPEPERASAVPDSWVAGMRGPAATPAPPPTATPEVAAAAPVASPPPQATLPPPHTISEPPSPADYRSPFEGPPAGSVLQPPPPLRPAPPGPPPPPLPPLGPSAPSTPMAAGPSAAASVSDPLLADISWAVVADTPAPSSSPAVPVYQPRPGYPPAAPPAPSAQAPAPPPQRVAMPRSDASAIDAELLQTTRRPPSSAVPSGPMVSAVRCPVGHLNSPSASHCRVCAAAIAEQEPVTVVRPRLGVLRLSTGDIVALDQGVILGRAPGTPTGAGRDEPYRIQLPSPDASISRKHVEIVLQDWSVTVVDLNSTNGTVVTPAGAAPEQLPAGGFREITDGTVVSLDAETWVRFEVTE